MAIAVSACFLGNTSCVPRGTAVPRVKAMEKTNSFAYMGQLLYHCLKYSEIFHISWNFTVQNYEKFQNLTNFYTDLFQNLIIYFAKYSKSSYLHYQPPAR